MNYIVQECAARAFDDIIHNSQTGKDFFIFFGSN